jgi:hypothetical protein
MAIVYPLANGNWSTVANWYSGGVAYGQLPLSTDDVYADGKTVTIDQDITVNLLTTLQRSGGTTGGGFNCTTARTISSVTITGTYNCLNLTSTGVIQNVISTNISSFTSGAVNIGTVNITGTSGTVNVTATNLFQTGYISGGHCIYNAGTATLNVIGNTIGNSSFGIANNNGILNFTGNIQATAGSNASISQNGASGTTNITGNLIGGLSSNGWCVYNAIGTVNILSNQTMNGTTGIGVYSNAGVTNWGTVGNPITITGAPSSAASGLYACYLAGGGTVTLYGNIVLQNYSYSTSGGLFRAGSTSGVMTINGNITGGTVANTIGLNIENTGTVTVNGNVTGGSNATNTPAISMSQAGTINLNGNATAGSFPAINSSVTTAKFNLLGNVTNVAGMPAYYGSYNIKISPTVAQQFTFQDTSNANRVIATSNISPGAPAIANVRFGTIYGSSSEFTGTLRVPNPTTVALGVLTDNTTGTMLMTPSDFWNTLSSTLTTSGSIGERLKTASTVQTNGDQLASYIV